MSWSPRLPDGPEPLYDRLRRTLAADVEAGVLAPGERLPAQRDLAHRLGISLGTVTRAYVEAERQGLIRGDVGRGSFVRKRTPATADDHDGPVDLAHNLPPLEPARRALAAGMARIARRPDLAEALAYPPAGGSEAARRAGALWLARTAGHEQVSPERLICCAGAQQAVAVALGALCRPGEAMIVEEATFHGLKLVAAHGGYRMAPAAMDDEGMTPEALERAAVHSGARVAYVQPVQNPTARVLGAARRRDLVAVARRLDLMLVEDDLYAAHAQELGLTPLACLAPERVCYVNGLSKSLAPGLRLGYLVMPTAELHARALEILRAIAFGSPTFGAVLATEWIEDGAAFEMLEAVRDELTLRNQASRQVLGGALAASPMAGSPHLWLPLGELEAERVSGEALRAGARTTAPRAQYLDGVSVKGLRLCLGAAPDLATLRRGLEAVKAALDPAARPAADIV